MGCVSQDLLKFLSLLKSTQIKLTVGDSVLLKDLCERLWDICDTRKLEAENEREQIMQEGWLEDHMGLLTNHHVSLMQSEVNRYQETCKLLKDYYVGMEGGQGQQKGC